MKQILFALAPVLIFFLAFRPVHSLTVTGTITDDKGNPIMAAAISEKGTTHGTTSSIDGRYKILVSNNFGTLIISAAGFQGKEIKIKGKTVINVKLLASAKSPAVLENVQKSSGKQQRDQLRYEEMPFNQAIGYPAISQLSSAYSDNAARYKFSPPRIAYDNQINYESDIPGNFNTESYDHITENRFLKVKDNPLSTFSIDVDAASYSNVRRFLNLGQLPPAGAVRIEELVNYFHYEYPQPTKEDPFSINTEISDCPWNKDNKLVLIGLQGKKIPTENLPASNLVFLIDVSGSMDAPNRLPLVKASMKMLVDQLREQDKVAIVVYAGNAGLVLPSTSGDEKIKIKEAIDNLDAGGSTAGGAGIKLAYKIAKQNFSKEGNNRVILCTDGDFNIGVSSDDEMERLIEQERKSGVFLTVLGYGMGNYKDSKMQKLADKGNGNHAYIDQLSEAKKVLVNEFGGTLFTIAKDVKLQIEFNPVNVQGYRLIGYENRMLNKEDFNNDKKDAGELGSGHTVTALYEIIPAGVKSDFLEKVDPLKYQGKLETVGKSSLSGEMMTVKFRYKAPDADVSKLIVHPVLDKRIPLAKTSDNFRFAASVAEFGMLLRSSEFKSNASFTNVLSLARNAKGADEEGYRSEFIKLVQNASTLAKENDKGDEDKVVKDN